MKTTDRCQKENIVAPSWWGSLYLLTVACFLFFEVLPAHSNDLSYIGLYDGWYVETHDDEFGVLTARLYGDYSFNNQRIIGYNPVSFRCEKNRRPYLRIVYPQFLTELIKKSRRNKDTFFTEEIVFITGDHQTKHAAWFSIERNSITIEFADTRRTDLLQRQNTLLSAMRDDFDIVFLMPGMPILHYKYEDRELAMKGISYLKHEFGTEFILQDKMQFIEKCREINRMK